VEVAIGYLGRPETLPPALKGVDAVYLAPLPATARAFAELAAEAKVRRVVTLSASHADEEDHYSRVERAVEEAGFDWTHVRPGSFMNNTLGWVESVRSESVVRAPYGDAAETPIDLGDIAAVAAEVLLDESYVGEKPVLTGPESISQRAQAGAIGAAIGRDVRFEELTPDETRAAWAGTVSPEAIEWLLDGFALSTAHPQVPLPTVEQITGRKPRTYAQWAVANAEQFR
jgi:uncharacterized protein YbjT (DUF2867 family)